MKPIHLRNVPPPLETFDHVSYFSFICSYLKPERYLELGVRDGRNFNPISEFCQESWGVDTSSCPFNLKGNMKYFQMTTDKFFEELDPNIKFDMIFIDADHSHEQSLKDFMNASKHIIEDGFIFFHDTYPYDPYMFDPGFCNDAYKTPLFIKKNLIDDFEILTLPFNPGVTMVKKISRFKQLIY
jgi:hypothetical protein